MALVLYGLLLLISTTDGFNGSDVLSDDFITTINELQSFWRAGRNFQSGSFVKNLLNVIPPREEKLPLKSIKVRENLPENFDSRKGWKRCRSLGKVKEQGSCASAWAIVAAAVFTDRLCIGKVANVEVSAQNVLSCCKLCGTNCYGGYVSSALEFLARKGAPSKKCHPYEIFGCPKTTFLNCPQARALNPRCRVNCRMTFNKRPFQDLRRSKEAYSLTNSTEIIKTEIITRGPVAAVIDLYEDFMVYKSGVYSHVTGRFLGHHPVELVGWGLQENKPFWIAVNSWSTLWGDRGYVKLAQGSNGCNLENRVFALDPRPQ